MCACVCVYVLACVRPCDVASREQPGVDFKCFIGPLTRMCMLMVVVVVMVISDGAGGGDSFSTRISSAAVEVLAVVLPWL